MASSFVLSFLLTLSWLLSCLAVGRSGGTFMLDVHHRFSDKVKRWAESMSWETGDVWPEKGSLHYYASLVEHDRAMLHRRGLAGGGGDHTVLTFEDGNTTIRLNRLGFLHYALVSIGTPKVQFLVALDTGSNLFWVPCDCKSCAPTTSTVLNVTFDIYNSNFSTTSKRVPCSSSFCGTQASCNSVSDPCPYKVEYLSPNLSTSGILLEDLLYLSREGTSQEAVTANITFGCGQVQTGDFLRNAAPNGLFGLGMKKISVPSILATAGLTSDSFSMCFSPDGLGRLRFGDNGSMNQKESPFIPNNLQQYVVNVDGIQINDNLLTENFFAIVDSGSSFTILTDPIYTNISEAFNSVIQDERHAPISDFPFEYCYNISSNATPVIPNVTLIMKGGSEFPIIQPEIFFATTDVDDIYCLAIIKSSSVNIIGQNFMAGLRIVFDREKLVLGWKEFDCYDIDNSTISSSPSTGATPPSIPTALPNSSIAEAPDTTGVDAVPPLSSLAQPLHRNSFMAGLILQTLLFIHWFLF